MTSTTSRLDAAGAAAACLCACHCVATPALLLAFPLSPLLTERAEWMFVSASVAISTIVLAWTARLHQRRVPLGLLLAGITCLLGGHQAFAQSPRLEIATVIVAAALFSGAHFLNQRFCRACAICCSPASTPDGSDRDAAMAALRAARVESTPSSGGE